MRRAIGNGCRGVSSERKISLQPRDGGMGLGVGDGLIWSKCAWALLE